MKQIKYLCKDFASIEKSAKEIAKVLSEEKYKSALVTFYETGFSARQTERLIEMLKGTSPDLQIAGLTVTIVAELMREKQAMLLNLILTEETDIEVVMLPCLPGEEIDAAKRLKSRLDSYDAVKAVELFGSNLELNITDFMEKAMVGHKDAVLFGTSTLRNLTAKVSGVTEENQVELESVAPEMVNEEFAVGDRIVRDGFVAVIFAGEKLKVQAEYALGWHPIGRKLPIELAPNSVVGETIITKIKDKPAVDIYKEYLGVYADAFFISNICEFPFVVEREGIDICMVPLYNGKDGELSFLMKLNPGEKVRFTFASHDEVLNASRESLDRIEEFGSEALFLTLCGNRINFLKEDAHLEWDGFAHQNPDYALMHGAGELYYYNGVGGVLNSAHLAIGFKESDDAENKTKFEHVEVESLRQGRILSLSDRMSTFLSKITAELVDMASEAQDANNAKSKFLSHMSHEIRTPINAILGMDEMILQNCTDTDILGYADDIRSAGNNLLGIINDILDFSKIEAGKMQIVPVEYDFRKAIKDIYNIVHYRAEDKGIKVVLDIDKNLPTTLFGDVTRINQVVANLLTNAVKYTETGTVTLKLKRVDKPTPNDAEQLAKACPCDREIEKYARFRITVKDTGIGIKPEDMEKLFGEYERFDENRNRGIEGTGLGLSITQELLELMGSSLAVSSVYGEGSEFEFEILQGVVDDRVIGEVGSDLSKTMVKRARHRFTAEDARILVVDDNEMNLTLMNILLQTTKIHIDTVESGEAALKMVSENAYDLIFLDHLMPEMSGPETLERFKTMENNRSAGAPVISLTANAEAGAREEYIRMGYQDYLSKPFDPEELVDAVFHYIPSEKIRTIPM